MRLENIPPMRTGPQAARAAPHPEGPGEIRGTLARIRYTSDEGFLIGSLADGTAIKGFMPFPEVGLEYELAGEWENHPRFGPQLNFASYRAHYPKDEQAIADYLAIHCEGIGPKIAAAIVDAFGEASIETLRDDPERVAGAVSGLSEKYAEAAAQHLRERAASAGVEVEVRRLFVGVRIPGRVIQAILSTYKEKAAEVIRANPYQLIEEIDGVGFKTADTVGRNLGLDPRGEDRVRAGIIHMLTEAASSEGHCYLETETLVNKTGALLSIPAEVIAHHLAAGVCGDAVTIDGTHGQRVYLTRLFEVEKSIARDIARLQLSGPRGEPIPYRFDDLADDQNEAVTLAMQHPVFILTGSAGTGKTTAVRRILECYGRDRNVALCAPTGKAAKRLQEATGRQATTIHRLLKPAGVDGGNFKFTHNRGNPLTVDVLVADECSMIDARLFSQLISAVRGGAKLLLIGDIHQLPPVGPGSPLRDLIASHRVPCYELTKIKRQDPGDLLLNCHRVRDGRDIETPRDAVDFFYRPEKDPEQIRQVLVDIVANRLPAKYGLDPRKGEIQVISPRRAKTELSAEALNLALQGALNTAPPVEGIPFRVGDRVIQRANDYDLDIVNGDVGTVLQINGAHGEVPVGDEFVAMQLFDRLPPRSLLVAFENPTRYVAIRFRGHRLELAYALTVHSTQGDTYPAVVVPVHASHGGLLMQRSLIYTAISRAKSLCVLVGVIEEANKAVRRVAQQGRKTALAMRLQREEGHASPTRKEEGGAA